MKAIKYLLMGLLVISAISCKKWLDVKPTSELDRSDLFSTEGGYVEALSGVYANLTKPALYGRELTWGTLDVLSGTYYPNITGEYGSMLNYRYKRSNGGFDESAAVKIDNVWKGMYTQIANLNALLETIDDNQKIFTGNNYSTIKGEALGLRAFLHFELLRMFGTSFAAGGSSTVSIPFVFELSKLSAPLLTGENAISLIIEDLKTSKKLLENDPFRLGTTPPQVLAPLPDGAYSSFGIKSYHNRRFSFNYYAAIATLSRAYLWRGDKVNALAYAKEIIAEQEVKFPWALTGNISTIGGSSPNQDRTFATEHIFALNIRKINDYMDGYIYFGTSPLVLSNLAPYAYFSSGGIFEGSTDIRQLYLATSQSGTKFSNKYYQIAEIYSFFQQRVPMIRVSEMYYIAAECETDLNQARLFLDAVRSKRGLSNMALAPGITRAQLDIEVRKEYQKEFIGEGQLWYYLKRNNLDLTDFSIQDIYHTFYFTNKNFYVFDLPDEENANR